MSATAMKRGKYQRRAETPPLQRALQTGVAGGIMALLVSLIGMVGVFNARDIVGGVISTGQALLVVLTLLIGYLAARRAAVSGSSGVTLAGGALAGGIVWAMLAALVLIGSQVNLREVLVNAAPPLYNILTFERAIGSALPLMLGLGLGLGVAGAALYLLPERIEKALIAGLGAVILVGLLRDLARLLLDRGATAGLADFLFASRGLTVSGALALFVLPFLFSLLWGLYGTRLRSTVQALPLGPRRALQTGATLVAILFLLIFPRLVGRFPSEVMNNVALLGILMGLGLNIVVGFAGLLDLGYVGFFAIGAYTMALLSSPEGFLNLGFWQALPFAILATVVFGVILGIPVLKMRGDYLAIVTLGFGEIIRLLLLSNALQSYTGGARGMVGIPNATMPGVGALNQPEELYYLLLASVALTWFISRRLRDSRLGRAWMAIREDEDVAEAMGINLVATKLLAFGTGAAMAGLGGAIFASKLQSIVPQSFDLLISVNALAVIIIGGLASIPGVVVGALLLIGLPELLREFAEYRLWVYGVLLVVMMIYRPEGFWPEETRRRELHDELPTIPEPATVDAGPTDGIRV